ncbi:MAG: pyridoxamine kinase [Eubacterium sp.]
MKRIAAINDLSGFGKCSLTANIPIISALGVQCCPLPTGILSNQTGYPEYQHIDFTRHMSAFAEQWQRLGFTFDGIISGFISNSRQGEIIADIIQKLATDNTIIVVDPVMADDGKIYDSYDSAGVEAIKHIVSLATVITPNLTELCLIANNQYSQIVALDDAKMIAAIKDMSRSTGKTVVTTGIHIENNKIANAIYTPDDDNLDVIENQRIGGSFSGTGDILTSIITAQMVKGVDIAQAVRLAGDFITKSIATTVNNCQQGYSPADGINFEQNIGMLTKEVYYDKKQ